MEGNRRVYPCQRQKTRMLCVLLLTAAFALLAGGLLQKRDELFITPIPAQTPIPMNESFDETAVSEEVSLPEHRWYALQLGVFTDEKGAREMAELFVKRGAAGYVWYDGKYRALAAIYPSKGDAQSVRERLSSQYSVDTYLYPVELHPLQLRISGMKGQLDILQAAFLHAGDLIASQYQISMELDQQTLSAPNAVSSLKTMAEQMDLVHLRLQQRFVQPRPAVVDALMNVFQNYCTFSNGLAENISLVELGMQVKFQNIHSLFLLQTVYDTLNHT